MNARIHASSPVCELKFKKAFPANTRKGNRPHHALRTARRFCRTHPDPNKTVGPALGFLLGDGLASEAGVAASVGDFSEYLLVPTKFAQFAAAAPCPRSGTFPQPALRNRLGLSPQSYSIPPPARQDRLSPYSRRASAPQLALRKRLTLQACRTHSPAPPALRNQPRPVCSADSGFVYQSWAELLLLQVSAFLLSVRAADTLSKRDNLSRFRGYFRRSRIRPASPGVDRYAPVCQGRRPSAVWQLLLNSEQRITRQPGFLDRAPRQLFECAYVLLGFLPERRQLRYLLGHTQLLFMPLCVPRACPCILEDTGTFNVATLCPQAQHALPENSKAVVVCAVCGGVSAGFSGRLPFWIVVWDRVEPDYVPALIRVFSRMACGSELSRKVKFLAGMLSPYAFLGSLAMWVSGQAQKILEIPDPIEVPVPVCHIPPARFGPCARVVLVGAEIDLARQGQPEPDQGLKQFLAGLALFDVLPDHSLDGRTERIDFVRFHEPPGYGRRPPTLPIP